MKSIRIHTFDDPEVLKLEQVPDPSRAADQVVVRAAAIGVDSVDTYIRSGKYGLGIRISDFGLRISQRGPT